MKYGIHSSQCLSSLRLPTTTLGTIHSTLSRTMTVVTARWMGCVQRATCMRGALQLLLNDTPNPCVGSLLGVQAWLTVERCSAANEWEPFCLETQRTAYVFFFFKLKTDGYMILLLLQLGVYACEAVICALPTRA